MSSFVQHLFVFHSFPSKEFFLSHILGELNRMPFYADSCQSFALLSPDKDDQIFERNEGWRLQEVAACCTQSPYGVFFLLEHLPTREAHGFNLQWNNLDPVYYLILDWQVKSLVIDEKRFLMEMNSYWQANEVYSAANWLGSVIFAEVRFPDLLRKTTGAIRYIPVV